VPVLHQAVRNRIPPNTSIYRISVLFCHPPDLEAMLFTPFPPLKQTTKFIVSWPSSGGKGIHNFISSRFWRNITYLQKANIRICSLKAVAIRWLQTVLLLTDQSHFLWT